MGKWHPLGLWKSPSSYVKYDLLMAEWMEAGRPGAPIQHDPKLFREVSQIVLGYFDSLKGNLRESSLKEVRLALRLLRPYYDFAPEEFGPVQLKGIRDQLLEQHLTRSTISKKIATLRAAFRWAAEEGGIDPSIWHGLLAVRGLRAGTRGLAPPKRVRPVAIEIVRETLVELAPTIRDMVELQLAAGMRPGEVCSMRPRQIETTGDVWLYRPTHHKTLHHGKERVIALGPRAQEIIKPRLGHNLDAPIFSPRQSLREARQESRRNRTSPLSCNRSRDAARAKRRKSVMAKIGDEFTVDVYRRAIQRACERLWPVPAGLDPEARRVWRREHFWHPHQLRHSRATEIRRTHGLDAAKAVLGHASTSTTEIYAQLDVDQAVLVARVSG